MIEKKPRKGINGKSSGNTYERTWAKKLSLLLTNGQRNDCVWRTSNSGGRATVTSSDTQCGDLHAVRPEATKFFDTFSLELKNYKPINLLHFNKENFQLYTWWKQASGDAERAKKIPLLIFNAKRQGEYFVLGANSYDKLSKSKLVTDNPLIRPSMIIIPPSGELEGLTVFPIELLEEVIIFDMFITI